MLLRKECLLMLIILDLVEYLAMWKNHCAEVLPSIGPTVGLSNLTLVSQFCTSFMYLITYIISRNMIFIYLFAYFILRPGYLLEEEALFGSECCTCGSNSGLKQMFWLSKWINLHILLYIFAKDNVMINSSFILIPSFSSPSVPEIICTIL